jgi:hypothetical protein
MSKPLDQYTDEELVAMPRPNMKLVDEVLDYIIDHQDQWSQFSYASRSDRSSCGTTMCFAGHASVLAGHEVTLDPDTGSLVLDGRDAGWYETARVELGLTHEEAHAMFYTTIHPTGPDDYGTNPKVYQLRNVKVEVERIRARAKAQDEAFNRIAQQFIDAAGLDDVVQPGYKCPESAEVLQGDKGGATE